MLPLEAYNISFSNLKSAPWRISQDDEDISRQHQAYRKLMWRKLRSVFILLCSLAQSVKWHLWWLTLWIKLSVLPLIDASYVPFILYFCPAYPPGCLSFIVMSFPIGAGWRHLAARGFSTPSWRCAALTVNARIFAFYSVI